MIASAVAATSASQTWTRRKGEYGAGITRSIRDDRLFSGQFMMGFKALSNFRRSSSAFVVEKAFFDFECFRFAEIGQTFGVFYTVLIEAIAAGTCTRSTHFGHDVRVFLYELFDAIDDSMASRLGTMAI